MRGILKIKLVDTNSETKNILQEEI